MGARKPVELAPLGREPRPLTAIDVPLLFLCHDDRRFLPSLLAHYRLLGVTRFICVDDRSTDGSRALLAAQPDVDVWTSAVRYGKARRGRLWREALLDRYGAGRWYVNVDADEYLVYRGCFSRPLPALIAALEARGDRRLAAPMLDFYPAGPVESFAFGGDSDRAMPWEVADHLDGTGYRRRVNTRFISVEGGPRPRTFGSVVQLMKYPLLYWDAACSFGVSIHQPTPYEDNLTAIGGALLHFKFFSDYRQRAEQAVENAQHHRGGREYRRILDRPEQQALDFVGPQSIRYESPEQLCRAGFFIDVFGAES